MKKSQGILALLALILASLACQTLSSGEVVSPEESSGGSGSSSSVGMDFPLTKDAKNVNEGDGTILYQTNLSVEEVMDFYREVFAEQGITERTILTNLSDGVFSMVFDGHPSGQSFVVQGFGLDDGTTHVSIRLELVD